MPRASPACRRGRPCPWTSRRLSLICALFGMYWDISLHIDQGRDAGPLANPAHYFILVGLFGIFAAGFLADLPARGQAQPLRRAHRPGLVRARRRNRAALCAARSRCMGFPLDDVWHRIFGQDVTLWGPTHLMLIGGAGLALLGNMTLLAEAGAVPGDKKYRSDLVDSNRLLKLFVRTRYAAMVGGLLIGLSTFQAEFDFGVPQFRMIFQPLLIALAASIALVVARLYAGRGGALLGGGLLLGHPRHRVGARGPGAGRDHAAPAPLPGRGAHRGGPRLHGRGQAAVPLRSRQRPADRHAGRGRRVGLVARLDAHPVVREPARPRPCRHRPRGGRGGRRDRGLHRIGARRPQARAEGRCTGPGAGPRGAAGRDGGGGLRPADRGREGRARPRSPSPM